MISLAGHAFDPHKACFMCQHVFDGAPVLAFAHDEDGDLQVACGAESHTGEDWRGVGVAHLDCDDFQLASRQRSIWATQRSERPREANGCYSPSVENASAFLPD